MNRLWLSLKAWWKTLVDPDITSRIQAALEPTPAGPDLRILALLQRDGRLIDFLQEDISPYTDEQIGAAVRDIHRGCRKAIAEYLTVAPVLDGQEDDEVTVAPEFDPAAIRLLGNVSGSPPYSGTLKHHGWRVREARIPAIPATRNGEAILAPAEVEIR